MPRGPACYRPDEPPGPRSRSRIVLCDATIRNPGRRVRLEGRGSVCVGSRGSSAPPVRRSERAATAGRMADAHRAPRPRRRGAWADAAGRRRRSASAGWRSSTCRPTATSRWPRRTAATSSSSTARSTTTSDLRARARRPRAHVPRHVRHRGHAGRRSSAWGVERDARARRRACSRSRCGTAHERALHLARDRLGEKPLYYGCAGRHASVRLGAEGAARPSARSDATVDRDALAALPALRLRPGAALDLRRASTSCRRARCSSIRRADQPARSPDALLDRSRDAPRPGGRARSRGDDEAASTRSTRCCATRSRCRMIADVPLGAFLSGGIDSSTRRRADAGRRARGRCRRSPSASTRPATTRRAHAAAVAAHLGTDHTELYVTPERGARGHPAPARRSTTSRSPTPRRSRRSSSRELARRDVTVASRATAATSCSAATTATSRRRASGRAWRGVPRPRPARRGRALAGRPARAGTALGRIVGPGAARGSRAAAARGDKRAQARDGARRADAVDEHVRCGSSRTWQRARRDRARRHEPPLLVRRPPARAPRRPRPSG